MCENCKLLKEIVNELAEQVTNLRLKQAILEGVYNDEEPADVYAGSV